MAKKNGRPTVCTPELTEKLCELLSEGLLSIASCAERVGICEATFYNWRERGAEGEEPFATFLEDSTRALAYAEHETISYVRDAARGVQADNADWRAAAWLAERRYKGKWSKPKDTEEQQPTERELHVHVHPGSAHPEVEQELTEDGGDG